MSMPILLVEDHDPDFELGRRGLYKAGVLNPVRRCCNGDEALHYLRSVSPESRPGLIVLDLNLPDISGVEVLRSIKEDPELQTIPVVVWSATEQPGQIENCYKSGASSFLPKRISPAEQYRDFGNLARFWLETVRLPNHPGES